MCVALDLVTIAFVCAGALFFLAGSVGLLCFPDPASHPHALTKTDNLGLIVLGLLSQAGGFLSAAKLSAVWMLVLLVATTTALESLHDEFAPLARTCATPTLSRSPTPGTSSRTGVA